MASTVTIVNACLRDGTGGSPTAVLAEVPMSDGQRRQVPVAAGTSHAVFVDEVTGPGNSAITLRFFTAGGELPACGHGTVAALAYLTELAGLDAVQVVLHASGRSFTGAATKDGAYVDAAFDPGPVELREPTPAELDPVLSALGVTPDVLAPGARLASVGRWRLLVPVTTRDALAALTPDADRLRAACDAHDLLGCYVYAVPTATGRTAARMFAPSIGVPEDIANANSTACLAAHLADQGLSDIAVDMGDSLGSPATITAAVRPDGRIHLGGLARVARRVPWPHVDGRP